MLKSMTAYGRAVQASAVGQFVVELYSVNRKHLEILVSLPSTLQRFDMDIRRWIGENLKRGRVSISIQAVFEETSPLGVRCNKGLAKQLHEMASDLGEELELREDNRELSMDTIMRWDSVVELVQDLEHPEKYRDALKAAVDEAMVPFQEMRIREGAALAADIMARLDLLDETVNKIEQGSGGVVDAYREKLMQRVAALNPDLEDNQDRIAREVALVAEKVDIAEEITRLRSHLDQFRAIMRSEEPSVGKTLDFLLQELFREANTVGSKAASVGISHLAVEIKAELERVREQVQNVE